MNKKDEIKLDHASLQKLIKTICLTCKTEGDCEQVFELLDQYAEQELGGSNPQKLMPMVFLHLEICSDCQEEYSLLLEMMRTRNDNMVDP